MEQSKLKTWMISNSGILIVSTVLLLLVAAESMLFPWSPYFYVFAVIALVVPLVLKTYRFGRLREVLSAHWKKILVVLLLCVLWDQTLTGWISLQLLSLAGVASDPVWSLPAAIEKIFTAVSQRMNISTDLAGIPFAVIALVWGPVVEELFYRGWLFGSWRIRHGFLSAAVLSSLFFGIRHMLPFLYLEPGMYWIPAITWGVAAFGFGMAGTYLYEKTNSLYPCMIVHALVNVASLLVM